jgi:hypothetical protein
MNLASLFRKSKSPAGRVGPHMTWATSSVGRSISRTGLFLKKQIWIWPILAVLLLSVIGLFVRHSIESTMRESLQSQLQTTLGLEAEMMKTWFEVQESNAESLANDLEIRQIVYQLLDAPSTGDASSVASNDALQMKLEKALGPALSAHDYNGYLVVDKKKRIVAAQRRELIGQQNVTEYDSFLQRSLEGNVCLSPPFGSVATLKDEHGRIQTGVPTMFVSAPIRDESFQVVGVLSLRIRPELEFSRIVGLGRFGTS